MSRKKQDPMAGEMQGLNQAPVTKPMAAQPMAGQQQKVAGARQPRQRKGF